MNPNTLNYVVERKAAEHNIYILDTQIHCCCFRLQIPKLTKSQSHRGNNNKRTEILRVFLELYDPFY